MIIKDSEGTEVYRGTAGDLIGEHDEDYETMHESDEYFVHIQEPGYYVRWCQGGKGCYFDGTFEAEEFDPKKLKFVVKETDYCDILNDIYYDGDVIDNNAGDYDIKSFEADLHHVKEFDATVSRTDYDYGKIDKVLQRLVDNMMYDPDNLEIGENISDDTAIKVIFDGYGDLDDEETGEYTEGGNKNMESYAIFIHKNSADPEFEFPEHDMTPWALIHRPDEEICIHAWHDVENESWEFSMIEDTSSNLNPDVIIKLFDDLYEAYGFNEEDESNEEQGILKPSTAWPFPNAN
jgi:hypothetical protein